MMLRLVFTKAPGAVAGIIRWITGSEVSHVGVQLAPDQFIAADEGGVKLTDRATFLTGGRRITAGFELAPEIEAKVDRTKILSYQGDGYDYGGLVWDLIPTLSWRWFKVRLGNPLVEKKEFWCSSFALVSLKASLGEPCPIPEFKGLDHNTVTPGQLEDAVSGGPSFSAVANP